MTLGRREVRLDQLSNKSKQKSAEETFTAEEVQIDEIYEKVVDISIIHIRNFKNHPFQVNDDKEMMDMADSIKRHGILMPIIVRSMSDSMYELISGHRRKRACELANILTIPAIIRNLDDNTAIIIMVDSNIQRETLLPSERAFAYQMKLTAMKRQGKRDDLIDSQVGNRSIRKKSSEILAEQVGESKSQIFRYIRLTNLISELLLMVDQKRIAFNPAVELSYLKSEEQAVLINAMEYEQATPSLSQAQRLKKYSSDGKLSFDVMTAILAEKKKSQEDNIVIKNDLIEKYFPRTYTPQQIKRIIEKLLEQWYKKQS